MKNQFDIGTFMNILTVQSATKNLCERFKKRRKEKGLSQRKVAERSGVSYSSVRRFESSGEISLHALMNLAQVLGCLADFNDLFATPIITDLKDYDND
jgi:transcriptional regulator with XRE-family HTH domain